METTSNNIAALETEQKEQEQNGRSRNIKITQKLVWLFIGVSLLVMGCCVLIGFLIGQSSVNSDDGSNGCSSSSGSSSGSGSVNNNISNISSSSESSSFEYASFSYESDEIDKKLYGLWETVIPNNVSASVGPIIGMQFVHSVLLPSGKVLFASGSSWRNNKNITQIYPFNNNPSVGTGLFNFNENPFAFNNETRKEYYKLVNSVGIYDPKNNTFFRIPHPLPNVLDDDAYDVNSNDTFFLPTDLFCSDQMHLRDGNILFVGGTQYYYPYRTGHRATQVFDWQKELTIDWTLFDWTVMPNINSSNNDNDDDNYYPWVFTGAMKKARWYPHTIEMLDGKMVIFSGFIGIKNKSTTYDDEYSMYPFEINKGIDIFDYDSNNISNSNLTYIDVSHHANSPFQTRLDKFPPIVSSDRCQNLTEKSELINRQCEDYKNDTFKLYPNNYLLYNNTIYLTREGDWNSLRDANASCIRRTKHTYFMKIDNDNNNIEFTYGPDRPSYVTMSGTTVLDPNTNNKFINLYGGMKIDTWGTVLPSIVSADDELYNRYSTQYVGSRGTRQFIQYSIENNEWKLKDEEYLGNNLNYDRTMHFSIILPTKEILIINGGNYDFSNSVNEPLLLTPIYDNNYHNFTGEYKRKFLAKASQPRLYHSGALLLNDGRILTYGGNAARASININGKLSHTYDFLPNIGQLKPNIYSSFIDVNINFFKDGKYSTGVSHDAPSENWNIEIFNPPYMYIDSSTEILSLYNGSSSSHDDDDDYNYIFKKYNEWDNEYYYLFHSNDTFIIELTGVPSSSDSECDYDVKSTTINSLVLIKLASSTHGWDQGQRLYNIEFEWLNENDYDMIQFTVPFYKEYNIVPAFYHLFFVDCKGKPTKGIMVRFDDQATTPF